MRRRMAVWTAAMALACAVEAAEPHWIRVASPHFEIYSSGGAGAARDTLREFEQVRSFFYQVAGHAPAKALPVRIVAFGSAKEYDAVRINEFAAAFYQSTADHDFIVMGPGTTGTSATAIHEYVHLVVRHSNLRFPPWLNEGIAELYSTIKPMGDRVLVGSLIPGRQMALMQDWTPLATIVEADQSSAYYNEKNKAGSLYNEGWALTHMLALRDGYRPKFGELMIALNDGSDTAGAFRTVYGKSVAEIERELKLYLRGDRFQGVLIPAKIEKLNEKLTPEPVAPFDVGLTLAEILNRPGHEAESRKRFQELIAEDGKRPEPHAELAYLEWRAGQTKDALPEFEKAYGLGARGPRLLWDYGRLSEREPAKAVPVLAALLEEEPARMDVRLELAETQLRARRPQDALQTLGSVRQVTKSDAPRLFHVIALAEWQAGQPEQAKQAAEKFRSAAATAVDRAEAERLIASIERAAQRPDTLPQLPAADDGSSRAPVLRRTAPNEAAEEAPKPLPSIEGTFERLDCAGRQARFVVRTGSGLRTLRIEDPARVAVTSEAGGSVELACGAQSKAVKVTVEYEGEVVRAIRFR